jgi:hypothetical protein
MATEAFISELGMRATLSIGAWSANVDTGEFRAWAVYSGFDVVHVGGSLSKFLLKDDADCQFTMLTWSDTLPER